MWRKIVKYSIKKMAASLLVVVFGLTGCASDMGSTDYVSANHTGKVLEGMVLSARPVTIRESDNLKKNSAGMVAGGLTGAVAGSMIGKGKGSSLAAVGTGLAGAAIGSLIEKKMSTQPGHEYVVRLDPKYVGEYQQIQEETHNISINGKGKSVNDEVKSSVAVTQTKTDLISVIQGNDIVFQPGQKVLIMFNNDRPRLAPSFM